MSMIRRNNQYDVADSAKKSQAQHRPGCWLNSIQYGRNSVSRDGMNLHSGSLEKYPLLGLLNLKRFCIKKVNGMETTVLRTPQPRNYFRLVLTASWHDSVGMEYKT
eukprot:scaffold22649_cov99-Cylindrotheca_fusiformis.AAC.2